VLSLLSVHMKSTVFFHELAFDNKALKHSSNFESVENVRSSNVVEFEFELRHISSLFTVMSCVDIFNCCVVGLCL